jgi:hypothetical protein
MSKISLSLFLLFFAFIGYAQPPACTTTLLSGTEGTRNVSSGEVVCVPAGSGWLGNFLVQNGGHVVICRSNFTGSVTIQPGGTLWDSPAVTYTGALANFGSLNRSTSNCTTCSAPSSGTLTTPSAICSGSQTGINGSAVSGANYEWQRENTLNANNWVSIGGNTEDLASGTIGNLTTTTRFRRRTSACSPLQSSAWVTVTITVNALPSNPLVAVNGSRCGPGTVNLSVTGATNGTTVDWYAAATGGALLTGGSATANYTTPNINTITTYYAELRNTTTGCVSGVRIPVDARVNDEPNTGSLAVDGSRCGPGTVNLSVTGATNGTTVDWYAASTGGSVLTGGTATANYTTPTINSSTTYYAELRNSTTGCVSSSRIPVTATILQQITNTSITGNNNVCTGESSILTATATLDNNITNTYAWYRTSVTPANLISNNSSNTLSVNQSGNYFVVITNSVNNTCRDTVNSPFTFKISQTPNDINITGDNSVCTDQNAVLTANGTIDNTVTNNYAWYRTSVSPSNLIVQNTSNTLSVNQSGNYYVIVTNGANNNCKDTVNNPFTVLANFNNVNTTIQSTNNFLKGSTAIFNVVTPSNNLNYIWQSDFGQGFQSLRNYGNYNGVNTTNLTVSNIQLSAHNQPIRVIASSGNCTDTSNIVIINILDTCANTINTYDTLLTTVTDTLVINAQITNVNIPTQINTLKVFPNPASSHIYIDYGNFNSMNGYTLSIFNSYGQVVFTSLINQQTSYIDLATWSGKGVYYIRLIDLQKNIIETRKLLIN